MSLHTRYQFNLDDNSSVQFDVYLDDQTLELSLDVPEPAPEWLQLEFAQCDNCPLSKSEHTLCPAAVALSELVAHTDRLTSYDKLEMIVTTEERQVRQNTTAQKAISSLMGLLIATSGCPNAVFFRPLARFHLPLATEEETVFRVAGTYFLNQYFQGEPPNQTESFDALNSIYQNMEMVNRGLANRIRAIAESDSSVNAISILDILAKTVPWMLDDSLDDIRYMFEPHLNDTYRNSQASI